MKLFLLFLYIKLTFANYNYKSNSNNISELVFNIYRKDIHTVSVDKLNSSPVGISYKETNLLINTTGIKSYIGQIDYNLKANILIWRMIEPENGLYVLPINKSAGNLLGIQNKTLLLKLNKSSSIRLSMDWIHNLVYYNFYDKIIAVNITEPEFGHIVVTELVFNTILDLCVDPLDSLIFWSVSDTSYNRRGKINRANQDGSNQITLVDTDLKEPIALALDLVLKRVFWIDRLLFKFCSIDFDGKDLKVILKSRELFTLSYFMTVFGEDIYWSNYYHSSILKTNKFGLNGTQINYLVKAETGADIESIKIIDPRLQPQTHDRCWASKCSHLCLPISEEKYRCVCPQLIFNTRHYLNNNCSESTHIIEKLENDIHVSTTTAQNIMTIDFFPEVTTDFPKEISTEFQTELCNTSANISKDNSFIGNSTQNFKNSLKKTLYIRNYKTSNILYIILVISLTLNFISLFAFIFYLYRQRKCKLSERMRNRRSLVQFKPIEFELINSENYHLINSNPLISNNDIFSKNDTINESFDPKLLEIN